MKNLRRSEMRFELMKSAAILAVGVLMLFGCGKKSEPATQPRSSETPAPGAPPPKYVTAAAQNAPAENVSGEVNAFLTEQLRIFIREKGRAPSDFAELARARLDSVPRPPEGKKWVIDNATKEVKTVASQ